MYVQKFKSGFDTYGDIQPEIETIWSSPVVGWRSTRVNQNIWQPNCIIRPLKIRRLQM